MADSLTFDGSDDTKVFSPGDIAGTGALTILLIFKPNAAALGAGYHWLFNWNSGPAAGLGFLAGNMLVYDGATERSGPAIPAADEWYLVGMSKATGTVTPVCHLYRYSTSGWTHNNASGTIANWPTITGLRFCEAAGENAGGNLLIAGVWDSELSNGTIEGLISSKPAWTTAAPDEAWRFDTTGTITPFVGTSTETASAGTTLATGDVPSGWSDTGTTPQTLLPSADSVDGNWTDQSGGASLAAAIDETSFSDSDYIRSELGPSNSACRVKLASGGDPASSSGHIIHWRAGKDTTGGATIGMTVKLYQGGGNSIGGGTLIASFTRSNVDAFTTYDETLSAGEADSITNYADLYLEFSANQT